MKIKPLLLLFIPLILFLLTSCSGTGPDLHQAAFIRVVDGDTLIADIDGQEEYVRLLLVDTPETKHPNKGVEPFGPEASNLMEESFSPADPIYLEYGTERRDKYDRILAYVYTKEKQMFNKLLLEEGLARVAYVFPPNDKYADKFRKLEAKAASKQIGIWSINGYVTDRGFNMRAVK
jgi:micrococcal nuclease